jgi:hypothetical protein
MFHAAGHVNHGDDLQATVYSDLSQGIHMQNAQAWERKKGQLE